ncbi:tetratricopeptide repeat protein 39B [Pundamilia nyererei]|uniref:Tetratricopeptide repeat protein 39B n=1 Tax=Pundamilia nyererei TaxID=303518 RepID=A0A9Y3VUG0_9CICH|nr:PREDICTED: tetratricopeptide repeat protein 39B-like [Pundamilia nyererei]
MAHVGNGAAAEEEDCFEDAFDRIPAAGSMDLQTAIQETQCALNLVLNNKFSQALDLLKPWWRDSMYHALGYSSILVMQATMTFEHRDIQTAMATIKEALHTCQRFRKKNSMVGSLSGLISKQSNLQEGEMHAELCYAECLLQKATLTFVQVRNAGFGLSQLREGASSHSLRSILCVLTLLFYHTYVSLILGTAEGNLVEAEALLEPYQQKYPKGSIILFYSARIAALRGNFEKARAKYEECVSSQQEWKQIHHLCYWELMWTHSYQQEWEQAYQYADLLCKESRWSKAIYVYQKAAILSMMSEEELKKTGENVVELFRQVEGLKQRLAGKSIPTEKFAVRKSRRYKAANPIPLVIPLLEMMYVWNGFTIVGKRADCAESLLVTIEKAEEQLRNDPNPSEFHTDDSCLVQMLKGLCLKHLGRLLQAELCFTQVLSSEGRIRYDHYLIPFTLYELGLLYKQQGDFLKATTYIENAKTNYKDYSMESRLHFRIHAALNSLKGSPAGTP